MVELNLLRALCLSSLSVCVVHTERFFQHPPSPTSVTGFVYAPSLHRSYLVLQPHCPSIVSANPPHVSEHITMSHLLSRDNVGLGVGLRVISEGHSPKFSSDGLVDPPSMHLPYFRLHPQRDGGMFEFLVRIVPQVRPQVEDSQGTSAVVVGSSVVVVVVSPAVLVVGATVTVGCAVVVVGPRVVVVLGPRVVVVVGPRVVVVVPAGVVVVLSLKQYSQK